MTDPTNRTRDLAFADSHLGAILVENVRDYEADGIVVNLTARTIYTGGDVPTPIRPWRSTILRGQTVASADRIAVLKVTETENLGGVMLRGWTWFGDIYAGFPRQTPLFMSAIDDVGQTVKVWAE